MTPLRLLFFALILAALIALSLEKKFRAFLRLFWFPWAVLPFIASWTNRKTAALATLIYSIQSAAVIGLGTTHLAEPFRTFAAYILEALRMTLGLGLLALPFCTLFTGLVYLVLQYVLPKSHRDLMRRFLLLSSAVFTWPVVLWGFFFAAEAVNRPSFQIVMGKPAWVASSLVTLLASYHVVILLAATYLLYVAEGLRRIGKMPVSLDEPFCTKCGYNLTGNLSGVCPECGTGT